MNGGERVYGKIIATGIEKITTKISSIEEVDYKYVESEKATFIFFKYPDRNNKISLEYCLPIVLLLAWQFSLFFDRRIKAGFAFRLFGINFLVVYFLQIIFPLLLFNISQSKFKSMSLFIGLQIFVFLVFFLILKDNITIKKHHLQESEN